jgi:hypothetical protein
MKRIGLLVFACATLTVGAAAAAQDAAKTYTGIISDHRCGANVDADCNKRCFEQGETPVLVADGSGDVFDIANGGTVTSMPGAHVEISATADASGKTLTVLRVKALEP